MRNIFTDIATAMKLTGEIRKARKDGASAVQLRPVYTVPYVKLGPAYPNTIEWCQTWKLGHDVDRAIMEVFKGLPYETQRQLEFTPKRSGGWVERARFWQRELQPVLPPKMYHATMALLISLYARILQRKASATA